MNGIITTLMAYAIAVSGSFSKEVGYNSQLVNPGNYPPVIEFLPQEQLNLIHYQTKMDKYPYQVLGLYMGGQLIYLPQGSDMTSIKTQSVVLHEIVHYLQEITGIEYKCQGDKERLAIYIQEKWLKEKHNLTLEEATGIPPLAIVFQMMCDNGNMAKPGEGGP